jgi:hypothetical protein
VIHVWDEIDCPCDGGYRRIAADVIGYRASPQVYLEFCGFFESGMKMEILGLSTAQFGSREEEGFYLKFFNWQSLARKTELAYPANE